MQGVSIRETTIRVIEDKSALFYENSRSAHPFPTGPFSLPIGRAKVTAKFIFLSKCQWL